MFGMGFSFVYVSANEVKQSFPDHLKRAVNKLYRGSEKRDPLPPHRTFALSYLLPLPWNNYCNVEHVDEGKIIMQWCILSYILVSSIVQKKYKATCNLILFIISQKKGETERNVPNICFFSGNQKNKAHQKLLEMTKGFHFSHSIMIMEVGL